MATNSSFRTLTLSNIEGIAEEKNYLKSNFENASTSGWNKFTTTLTSGVPTGSLTVGTAASITFFDAYAVNPLTGKLSLRVNSGNTGWTAGQGIISDVITIDRQDQGKVLNITFDYEPTINPSSINFSGVLGQQTFAIYVYDVTASAWVQPAGFLSMTGRGISTARATFQTAMVAGQQYRVAIVCLQTTPSISVGLVFDNFQMTRSNYIYGTPVTDWQSYTPTFNGFGTPTNVDFQWRRVGSDVEIRGKFTSGTTTAVEARVGLPSITSADTSRIASLQLCGFGARNVANAENIQILIEPSVTYFTLGRQESALAGVTKQNGNGIAASGNIISFFARAPISGWSSSVQTSDQTDTRVVSAVMQTQASNYTLPSSGDITWSGGTIFDTHGAFNGTTSYVVPVSGIYQIGIEGANTSANTYFWVYKNGTQLANSFGIVAYGTSTTIGSGYLVDKFNAGDILTIRSNSAGSTILYYSASTYRTTWSVTRLSGPSAIAASETIAMRYTDSSGGAIGTSLAVYKFQIKDFDTHSAYSTSTGLYTVPISGKYQIAAAMQTAAIAFSITQAVYFYVYKNGSAYGVLGQTIGNGTSNTWIISGSDTVQCNAGDTISIYIGATVATTANTASTANHISIVRIGN